MDAQAWALFSGAFLIGLGAAAPIGPINIEIIRRGLTIGPLSALSLGCGAVSADCVYFTLCLTAAELATGLLRSRVGSTAAFVLAGGMLAWLGTHSLRSAIRPVVTAALTTPQSRACPTSAPPSARGLRRSTVALRTYLLGLALTLANPMTVAFWMAQAARFTAETSRPAPWWRLAGVGSGALAWVAFLVSVLAWARRRVTPGFLRGVNLFSGALLCLFALYLAGRAVTAALK